MVKHVNMEIVRLQIIVLVKLVGRDQSVMPAYPCQVRCTLIDPTLSCPGSLLKTTPPPPGYPWVSGGRYVTPEPRFRGLVLDHQLLKAPETKNR